MQSEVTPRLKIRTITGTAIASQITMRKLFPLLVVLLITSCGSTPEFDRDVLDRIHDNDLNPSVDEEDEESRILRITFLNVGQGDATLIETPNGETILIDAGPPGTGEDVILPYLKSKNLDKLTHIIATHYHADHIGGIPEVIAGPDGEFDTNDDLSPTGFVYDRGEDRGAIEQAYYPVYADVTGDYHAILNHGDLIISDDLTLEVVAVSGELIDGNNINIGDPVDENAASIAMLIEYGGFTLFIGGDLTGGGIDKPDIESPLAPLIGDIDILRVSHHGSRTSTNQTFLDHTKPEVAIISYGEDNDHDHPHEEVINRLTNNEIYIHETSDGHVIVEVDSEGEYYFLQ